MAVNFDRLADAYEAMIDWPKRLGHEQGFYRRLFESVGARRVLDVACGTGHHAARFHEWGLEVEGADISSAMIERCRHRVGEPDRLRWVCRGFDQPVEALGAFDVALCVGNSLALAADEPGMERAISEMLHAVRPGGVIVVHLLNLWRLPDGVCQWQKCVRAKLPGSEALIIKGVHRCGTRGFVDLLITPLDQAQPPLHSECTPFHGLTQQQLERWARKNGARETLFYGGYQDQLYDAVASMDLIMVAARG